MTRTISGITIGLFSWFLAGAAIHILSIYLWPDYQASNTAITEGAAPKDTYTLAMLILRLFFGVVACVVAGWITIFIAKQWLAFWVVAGLLMSMMLSVHLFMVWELWPLWYHLSFLVPFIPLMLIGAYLARLKLPQDHS